MDYLRPERLDRLAREYALGTLAGRARRRFERVIAGSSAAAAAVQAWQRRLAVLEGATVPLAPPAGNWAAIERRLFAPEAAPPPTARAGLRAWLEGRPWAGALGGLVAGAFACAVVLRAAPGVAGLEPSDDEALPASYVGVLQDTSGRAALVVSSRRQGRVVTLKLLRPVALAPGQVAELWALPHGGKPFAVGALPADGSARVALPDTSEALFSQVSDLGVSVEPAPAAGAHPPAPSTPFVLTGHCAKVW